MKSKPVYGVLELDLTAKDHLFILQGAGSDAVCRLMTACPDGSSTLLTGDTANLLHEPLLAALKQANIGTAFYIVGSEVFLWDITRILRNAGVETGRIRHEVAGSLARRVYCVHCRTVNNGVTATVHPCEHCGLNLAVRDHFSRPLGAYMGVIADAEVCGDLPTSEQLYL